MMTPSTDHDHDSTRRAARTRRSKTRWRVGLVCAPLLLLMAATAPAAAQHHGRHRGNASAHPIGITHCALAPTPFERGVALGRSQGYAAGYQDALASKPFCDGPPYGFLQGRRPAFKHGFQVAYTEAYASGFRARTQEIRRSFRHRTHVPIRRRARWFTWRW